ncbi:MAG: 30S ribosome-binding factor RbfA [Anaerolineae bacterium]
MATFRKERANSYIQEQITLLLRKDVRDPRVESLVVTGVDLTPDRRIARVYVTAYAGEEALQEGLAGLESAKSFLRSRVGQTLHWRFTPELEFRVDRSWAYGEKIDSLLRDLQPEMDAASDDDEPDT